GFVDVQYECGIVALQLFGEVGCNIADVAQLAPADTGDELAEHVSRPVDDRVGVDGSTVDKFGQSVDDGLDRRLVRGDVQLAAVAGDVEPRGGDGRFDGNRALLADIEADGGEHGVQLFHSGGGFLVADECRSLGGSRGVAQIGRAHVCTPVT